MYAVTSPDRSQFYLMGSIHCKMYNDLSDEVVDVISKCTSIMTETDLDGIQTITDVAFPKTSTLLTDVLSTEVILYISEYLTMDNIRYLSPDDAIRWLLFVIIYTNYPGSNKSDDDVCYVEHMLWNMFDDRHVLEDVSQHISRCQLLINNLIPEEILQEIRDNNYSLTMITKLVDTYLDMLKQFDINDLSVTDEKMLNNNGMIDAIITKHKSDMLVVCGILHIEGINDGLREQGWTVQMLANSAFIPTIVTTRIDDRLVRLIL